MQEIGPHRLTRDDIRDGLDSLMIGQQADVTYVDPPWGLGHEKSFYTALLKVEPDTTVAQPDHEKFMDSLFSVLWKHSKNMVFVEYGLRWESEIRDRSDKAGFIHQGIVDAFYKDGGKLRPYQVHVLSKEPVVLTEEYYKDASGRVGGRDVAQAVVRPFVSDGDIMLDPCCGLGNFAKVAVALNLRFYGNEFNPKRLQRTEEFLRGAKA